ncbi:hypothetical protein, partial [Waltera sp.]|uniref:hypothetical protein n=2 Tax=Bacillota TaxID=1239 RepID=UPI003078BD09
RKENNPLPSKEDNWIIRELMELRFDYSDGDYCFDMGGNMMMDSDGNLMQDIGGGVAMDMESGEMHIVESNSSFGSSFEDED